MANLEQQLQQAIDTIKADIAEKQKQLAEAEQNMKDYKNNKTVVEKLLALATGKKPIAAGRGRKKKNPEA